MNKKGDGKGSKGGWTAPTVRACFGYGSTAHLIQNCPLRTTQKVQEVKEEMVEQEILFIGHTAIAEDRESWQHVPSRRKTFKGLQCSMPAGLDKVMTKSFRVLCEDEDEDDDDQEEMSYVRAVDSQVCAAGTTCTTDKKSWESHGVGDIVVDPAADESCCPQRQGDAFSTKPSKRKSFLKTANGGEMGHNGEKEVTFQSGTHDDDVVGKAVRS